MYVKFKPDLVTMDITMPEKDGITAVKEIMAADASARVIMCTAMGQQKLVMAAIQARPKHILVKPVKAERALHAIEKALS